MIENKIGEGIRFDLPQNLINWVLPWAILETSPHPWWREGTEPAAGKPWCIPSPQVSWHKWVQFQRTQSLLFRPSVRPRSWHVSGKWCSFFFVVRKIDWKYDSGVSTLCWLRLTRRNEWWRVWNGSWKMQGETDQSGASRRAVQRSVVKKWFDRTRTRDWRKIAKNEDQKAWNSYQWRFWENREIRRDDCYGLLIPKRAVVCLFLSQIIFPLEIFVFRIFKS